jgi:tRNA pseudouridine38-40 synthase
MRNLLFKISYDGTGYHGFQTQAGLPTVQETIESALKKLTGEELSINGCGRTDAGVHALNYYFNVRTESAIPCGRFPYALNSALPRDITASDCRQVDCGFNARFSPKCKTYVYKILNSRFPNALDAKRSFFYPGGLDIGKMSAACGKIVGTRDFRAFMASGSAVKSTIRTVTDLSVAKDGDVVTVSVTADGFLYNMVRIITGTLIYVGKGSLSDEDVSRVLESGARGGAGPTVPPHGLYLYDVRY